MLLQIGIEMEPPIQEQDEENLEEDEPCPPIPPRAMVSMETPQECATRLRRIAQSGEYRQQYQSLKAVKSRSGYTSAR